MQLLLCAATRFEIQPTIDLIREENIPDIDILITGIGMMTTAYSLTRSIHNKKPDFILQAGVAGCLDEKLPLTKIVLIGNESIGDLGVEENGIFRTMFDLKLMDKQSAPWKDGKLSNPLESLRSAGLSIVDSVTVNEISTNPKRISYYKNELGAAVESMEGAALHYVALQEQIPFLQMRSLSNFAGERDKSKWMLDVAIANLNIELIRILTKMSNK